jgi:hypothetical protein
MKVSSVLKVAALAAAVALVANVTDASARAMKLPPGACVFHRHVVAAGTWCSFNCDPKIAACSQQACANGQFVALLPCLQPFCLTPKCG